MKREREREREKAMECSVVFVVTCHSSATVVDVVVV